MIAWGTWADVLALNLRHAGALWSAWAGGVITMSRAVDDPDGEAEIVRAGRVSDDKRDAEEDEHPRRHLSLVE